MEIIKGEIMENLEILKQELLLQKQIIEENGGNVVVANSNPSPSEITNGIKTLTVPDLSTATATEQDVVSGKTFYAGNLTLKTGTMQAVVDDGVTQEDIDKYVNLFVRGEDAGVDKYYYTVPEDVKILRPYLLYEADTKDIEFTFNENLEEIGNYAFYKNNNTTFTNFSSLTKLTTLGDYAFGYISSAPISLETLPNSLTTLGARVFCRSVPANSRIVIPSSISTCGSYLFSVENKTEMTEVVMPNNIQLTTLPGYMFENLIFDCDFRVPSTVTSLAAGFAYGCSFNNITIPSTCTSFGNGAFYALKSESASYRKLKTVTFESEIPPTFGSNPFAEQDKTNGFKIYVPDNAVDTYKATSRLSSFINYIYPVSQKE